MNKCDGCQSYWYDTINNKPICKHFFLLPVDTCQGTLYKQINN